MRSLLRILICERLLDSAMMRKRVKVLQTSHLGDAGKSSWQASLHFFHILL